MRRIAALLVPAALLIAACAFAIRAGDRELVVSPPEIVAEEFFRDVVTDRFDVARSHLENENADAEIRRLAAELERDPGEVNDIKAETVSLTKDEALVTVQLESAHASDTRNASLRFSEGEWRLTAVP